MEEKIKELIEKYRIRYTQYQKQIEKQRFLEWNHSACIILYEVIQDLEELLKQ